MLIYSFIRDDAASPAVNAAILAVALLYGAWGFNGMGKRYIVYSDALEYRSLFKRWYYMTGDIDKVVFMRQNDVRLRITLDVKNSKKIVIHTNSLKDPKPLIDFCSRFERG